VIASFGTMMTICNHCDLRHSFSAMKISHHTATMTRRRHAFVHVRHLLHGTPDAGVIVERKLGMRLNIIKNQSWCPSEAS
jgi:hypothetical protein